MASSKITAFSVEKTVEPAGFLGRKTVTDELLKLETPGGAVYLRKSALEKAGDDWTRLKGRIRTLAAEKQIPYTDHTEAP